MYRLLMWGGLAWLGYRIYNRVLMPSIKTARDQNWKSSEKTARSKGKAEYTTPSSSVGGF